MYMFEKLATFIQHSTTKKIILGLWISLIVAALTVYFIYPSYFTALGIKTFISEYATQSILVYALICMVRGIFLIPSTPFVLAGGLLFPNQLLVVFIISLVGIIISGTFIYYTSNFLTFKSNQSKKIELIKTRINKYGFWIVLGWSFFPVVPTDLICYVAGKTNMHFGKYILALLLGEAVLIGIYLYFLASFI